MSGTDTGLRFWLRYVEARGGLTDPSGDKTIVLLPAGLQESFELPEEITVTADLDAAREDGAMFLAAGHPLLGRAADDVLGDGDVAQVAVHDRTRQPPTAGDLLANAREQFPVDHGRIDSTGAPARKTRAVLLVGALVSYALSTEEHYQERIDCFLDMDSHIELPDSVSAKLASLPCVPASEHVDAGRVTAAIGAAHHVVGTRAERRQVGLSREAAKAFDAELDRAETYYRDMLATIARRRENAAADRTELLDARARSVEEERERRLAEIREKFEPTHEIRPYRLYVYRVPVWRLPVDVRRGERRYPLELDWMAPLGRFADLRCPHCEATAPLVAGKRRLGCIGCLAKPAPPVAPAPSKPAPESARQRRPAVGPSRAVERPAEPPARKPHRVERTPAPPEPVPVRSPDKIAKLGDKLGRKVWQAVVDEDRRLRRMCALDSPAAAAARLYGPAAPAIVIGIPAHEALVASTADTEVGDSGESHAVYGLVETDTGRRFNYLLRWRLAGATSLIEEILPGGMAASPGRLTWHGFGANGYAVTPSPRPSVQLGPVGDELWRATLPRYGLPLLLRCLAAWWRIPDEPALTATYPPPALAGGIERMVAQRAGRSAGHYAEVASAYHVAESTVRAAGAELQERLQLSKTTLW